MSSSHPMMPVADHDEFAAQLFVRDFKLFLTNDIEPSQKVIADGIDPGENTEQRVETVYEQLHQLEGFRVWASLRRSSQELLWDAVARSVERQKNSLNHLASSHSAGGELTLDPTIDIPDYLIDKPIHLMPGGYAADFGPGDVSQGALMDRGGAVYMLGRNGGLMNDRRGHTVVAHLLSRFPDFAPERILEMGCGVGASTLPVASYFDQADCFAIDVGSSMLQYAHARAEHLGVKVHFSQQNAEATQFDDNSFDLVFSCAVFHETSPEGIEKIIKEGQRVLKPGGIMIHLEVPNRYESLDLWAKIRTEIEHDYNNEPNWKFATSADYQQLLTAAGFDDVKVGYQDSTSTPVRANAGFSSTSKGTFLSWFVASGVKG